MLDLCTFLALTRHQVRRIPVALYFHENQLTYPWSPTDLDPAQQRGRFPSLISVRYAKRTEQPRLIGAYEYGANFMSADKATVNGYFLRKA